MVSVNQNGVDVEIFNEVRRPGASVTISLDRAVQNAAQDAVNRVGRKAMIVAIKPSTGEILRRRAERRRRRRRADRHQGLYPPGSTFKIVTAGAAMDREMATPTPCSAAPAIDIGHRTDSQLRRLRSRHGADVAAFANSCNTTFAELAGRMPPRGLTTAAARDTASGPTIASTGVPTVTGSVPPTVDLAERTEDGFGQGKVLASPFGMAMDAATVAAGRTPVLQLIEGGETTVDGGDRTGSARRFGRAAADDAAGGHQRAPPRTSMVWATSRQDRRG